MNAREFSRIAQRLMSCPAAPYFEHAVAEQVEAICAENRLSCRTDEFGNLVAGIAGNDRRRGRSPWALIRNGTAKPLVLAAHMDHPGFELIRWTDQKRLIARFNGGVGDQYFRRGVRLRLMPGAIAARLGK